MKFKQLKRVLSVTLASAMLITSVPTGTLAGETTPTEQGVSQQSETVPATEAPAPATEAPAPATEAPAPVTEAPAPATEAPAPATEAPAPATEAPATEGTTPATETAPTTEVQTTEPQAPATEAQTPTTEAKDTEKPVADTTPTEGTKPVEQKELQEQEENQEQGINQLADEIETVTIVWQSDFNYTPEYNGTEFSMPTAKFTDKKNGEEHTVPVTVADGKTAKNADSYTLVASLTVEQKEKYDVSDASDTHTFEITKKKISVAWTVGEKNDPDYDGTSHSLTVTGDDSDKVDVLYQKEGTEDKTKVSPTDAGKYAVTVTVNDDNYILANDIGSKDLTIKQKEISVVWTENEDNEPEYDGTPHSLTVTGDNSDKLDVLYQKEGIEDKTKVTPKDAGNYTVTVDVQEDYKANYKLKEDIGSKDLTIKQKEISVAWTEGEKNDPDYDGTPHSLTVTGDDSDKVDVLYQKEGTEDKTKVAPKDAGNYTVTVEVKEEYKDNYKLPEGIGSKDLKIKAVEVTEITWEQESTPYVYSGVEQKPTASFTGINGTTVSFKNVSVVSKADESITTSKEAGEYTASVNLSDEPNYSFAENINKKVFSIEKYPATIEWGECTFEYNGKVQQPKPYFEGVGDDGQFIFLPTELTVTDKDNTKIEEPKDAKEYKATVDTGADTYKNYSFEKDNKTADYKITKLVTTILWKIPEEGYTFDEDSHIPEPYFKAANDGGDIKFDPTKDDVITVTDKENTTVDKPKEAKEYTATVTPNKDNYPNYDFSDESKTFGYSIAQASAKIVWGVEGYKYTYNGKVQRPAPYFVDVKDNEVKIGVSDNTVVTIVDDKGNSESSPTNVGTYTASITKDDYPNYDFGETLSSTYNINKLNIQVTIHKDLNKTYGNNDPENFANEYDVTVDETQDNPESVNEELDVNKELGKILQRVEGETVGTYDITLTCNPMTTGEGDSQTVTGYDQGNFHITNVPKETFTIKPLQITLIADSKEKVYGKDEDPDLTYQLDITDSNKNFMNDYNETKFRKELDELNVSLSREEGEDAGTYALYFNKQDGKLGNFDITYITDNVFTIQKLPVTITPVEGQGKIFGQPDPEYYEYKITKVEAVNDSETDLSKKEIKEELGKNELTRLPDQNTLKYESVGTYEYGRINNSNYVLTIPGDAPKFTIHKVDIESIEDINSRQGSFKVTTNLTGTRAAEVTTKFKVEAVEFPASKDGITFSEDIETYVENAINGIKFGDASDTIKIKEALYQKPSKEKGKELSWNGYLPAGTTIRVSVIGVADGTEEIVSSSSKEIKVSPVGVTLNWGGYETSASTGNYVIADKGAAKPLSLEASRTGEMAEILYNKNGSKGGAATYGDLNMTFTPSANNSGLTHAAQSVTANVVDTLNLTCEAKTLQFYVDDMAFAIPSSSIQFENRGDKITIKLPEMGTIDSVTIPGATVAVSGEMGEEMVFPVSWSGKDLIPTGTGISVTYTDQAGHQGTGTAAATRSSVSTPITFRIRPELNGAGYLNGRSSTLIISGTACACEPLQVSVAGSSQSVFATQNAVWTDSNGSWEVLADMSSLPENQDFTISAEYTDVSGSGYSISAKFDAFCASPALVSPVYEAMTHISGMVEPGTAVALVINGDQQNYYEIRVDRFGHFSMDDVPMMFGGEDSFDIYVTDIAGNVSIRHYEIQEPGDPFEVSANVNLLGKIFYSATEADSAAVTATPVSTGDFDEKTNKMELPLLFGMSYEVGTLEFTKTEHGFTVAANSLLDGLDAEDYTLETGKLYVYTEQPSMSELANPSGHAYGYGEEIPLEEGQTVWIAVNDKMTILADSIMDLKLYEFKDNSSVYASYQER